MWDKKRNTELRIKMAGLEIVEVMLMMSMLRWLGHVARMEETWIPKCLLTCTQLVVRRGGGIM